MTIRKGTGTIRRIHAKNFTQKESQLRLDESVKPYQRQGLNSLAVDAFDVLLYQGGMSTQVCTCKQTAMIALQSNASISFPTNVINPESDTDKDIVIDYTRPLFGTRSDTTNLDYNSPLDFSTDDDEFSIIDDDDEPTRTSENLFSANSDCGICYRNGYVPGYTLYGHDRQLLTTYSLIDTYGYHINQSKAPHVFDKLDSHEGYADFELVVPKFFKSVMVSIRNNHELLMEDVLYKKDTSPLGYSLLTVTDLRAVAGSTIVLRVLADNFTHVVLDFDLGIAPIKANIAQLQKNLDWSMFSTIGTVNVALPMTIREVHTSDFIVVPKQSQVWKVTDVPLLRTSKGQNLDIAVNCRVLQPQEPPKNIYKGRYLT